LSYGPEKRLEKYQIQCKKREFFRQGFMIEPQDQDRTSPFSPETEAIRLKKGFQDDIFHLVSIIIILSQRIVNQYQNKWEPPALLEESTI
jgi:hypothetical protein